MGPYLKVILLLVLTLPVLAYWKVSPLVDMAAGYMAKTVCSEHFVAGRNDTDRIRADVTDIDPLFGHINFEIGRNPSRVDAWAGPGLGAVTAIYREGLGCTIAANVDVATLTPLPAQSTGFPRSLTELPSNQVSLPALEKVLDRAFSEPRADSHRQTRAIVILHHGRVVAERYAHPFNAQTRLIGWSMSKSITNNLVGILVADGLLDLDARAPVREWQDPSDLRHAITLRHLLQMSSGLDFAERYEAGSDATRMLFTEYSAGGYAAQAGLAYPPGSHWSYSSGTSNILARIVFDKVGGSAQAVYRFAQARLFRPLGLESMVLEPDASGAPVGSSFAYATARDWARLGQFWLQDGVWNGQRILPEGWLDFSTQAAPAAPRGQYGAQFWLNAGKQGSGHSFPRLPDSMFYASGFNDQSVSVFPDQGIVAVRLGFTTDDSWVLGEFLEGVLAALNGGQDHR